MRRDDSAVTEQAHSPQPVLGTIHEQGDQDEDDDDMPISPVAFAGFGGSCGVDE